VDDLEERIESVAVLGEAVRRRLYAAVVARHPAPVGRDEAAAAAGVGRSLAAFHLDRLVDAGLLEAAYARPAGRGGPGAGRPAKLYRRASRGVELSLPGRDYELAARVLLDAADPGRLPRAARAAGRRLARGTGRHALLARLAEHGYEPVAEAGAIRLRNCPFHALAESDREAVCGMNLALLEGLVEGFPALRLKARLEPSPGYCCVVLR
jgi:predicted ArsR family transcriptional regulator